MSGGVCVATHSVSAGDIQRYKKSIMLSRVTKVA
jgi:hypothetical protein